MLLRPLILLLSVGAALPLAGCGIFLLSERPPTYGRAELANGLVVEDLVVPKAGPRAKHGDLVTIHYEGRLEDGEVFDSSYDRGTPITFELGAGKVPRGLDEGLVGLRLGGRRKLEVPGELGYGSAGVEGLVPPDATLHFDIELIELEGR